MKRIIAVALLALAASAHAQDPIPRTPTQECTRTSDLRFLGNATIDFSGARFVPLSFVPTPVGYVVAKIDGIEVLIQVFLPQQQQQ